MNYQATPKEIDIVVAAEQITEERPVVMTEDGEITGREGDFIVTHKDGSISVLPHDTFLEIYEPIPEE